MTSDIFYLVWNLIKAIIREFWWLFLFLILLKIVLDLRKKYKTKKEKEKEEIKEWETFEIIVNPLILQTPKAMEGVFNGLHALENGYLILEIVGFNQEVHFFIHLKKGFRNFVESQFYAQYPDLEIVPVKDWLSFLPPTLPNKELDVWGTEIILEKDNQFPIRTYEYFEETKEEKRIDPIANLIESISDASEKEYFIFQLIIRPLVKDKEKKFREEGQKVIDVKLGKKEKKVYTWVDWVFAFFKNLLVAVAIPPVWPGEETTSTTSVSISVSSIDKEIIEAVNSKISQLAFESGIRLCYFAPREIYNEVSIASFYAYLKQFSLKNLNSFTINEETTTKVKGWFLKNRKLFLKKYHLFNSLKNKKLPQKAMVLSSKELATIYHFPLLKVKSPALVRGVFRKSEPPFNLPK
ncbi:MAG TPA: hypothetical protein PL164_01425 [Candidatus Paceibacterota bacterium]|nr:hypothetical protein [Candidatus Paceibacterota bacterium]HOK97166.1 hypothetical protein [Candidatus Paceibacterota bacterium]HPP64643.1 hypothetical protein [Candidatus Paceibacterota bacterium]